MIAFRPHRLAALLLLASLASSVHADEYRAPVSPDRDGLAGAKEDYQAIKAAGRPSVQQSLDLPAIPTPTLPAAADAPAPPRPDRIAPGGDARQAAELKESERKKNWLVDALLPPDERAERASRENADGPAQLAGKDDASSRLDRAADRDERARISDKAKGRAPPKRSPRDRDSDDAKPAAFAAVNPLDRYMAAWMTPADRTLLLERGGVASGEGGAGLAAPRPAAALPDVIANAFPGAAGRGAASPADVPAMTRPAENPFLRSLEPALPRDADDSPIASAPPVPVTVPDLALPAAPAAGPTPSLRPTESLADQLKARDEADRAFRQLKRF